MMATLSSVAANRLFKDIWICMKCNAKNRGQKGNHPARCRKCKAAKFRLKKKGKKKIA